MFSSLNVNFQYVHKTYINLKHNAFLLCNLMYFVILYTDLHSFASDMVPIWAEDGPEWPKHGTTK
jgi:hypothetical protein